MKKVTKVILWMLVFTGIIYALVGLHNSTEQERIIKNTKTQTTIDSLQNVIDCLKHEIDTLHWEFESSTHLLSSIIQVESCNNDSAYRASEGAVGCLQIRQCMVNDINRILKRQKSTLRFTYNDRWSRIKSIQMFSIYCNYYNLTTNEEIARCWNGGPRGMNNPLTVNYWKKVKKDLDS